MLVRDRQRRRTSGTLRHAANPGPWRASASERVRAGIWRLASSTEQRLRPGARPANHSPEGQPVRFLEWLPVTKDVVVDSTVRPAASSWRMNSRTSFPICSTHPPVVRLRPLPMGSRRARRACPRSRGRSPSARQGGRSRRLARAPARPRRRGRRPGNRGVRSGRRGLGRARATRTRSRRSGLPAVPFLRSAAIQRRFVAAPARSAAPVRARQRAARSETAASPLTPYREPCSLPSAIPASGARPLAHMRRTCPEDLARTSASLDLRRTPPAPWHGAGRWVRRCGPWRWRPGAP
jgi:hypothetical protein